METGTIVRSKAGRDKDSFLVVMRVEAPYLILCDGKERPVERPKRKKILHTAPTKTVLKTTDLATNNSIRRALRKYLESQEAEVIEHV